MNKAKIKLPELRDYYKERLITLHAIRCLKSKPKISGGVWRPKRAFEADNITPRLLAKDVSPIDEIISNVYELVHNQYTEFIKNNDMQSVSANIENTNEVEATEESSFIDAGVRLISYAKNFITGGKKFKKRKAL